MNIEKFMKFMNMAEKLKCTLRHSWTSNGRQESVAEHSWRMCLMAYALKDKFKDFDMEKVLLMCLVHDLGEAITGDIPVFYKNKEDEEKELEAMDEIAKMLGGNAGQELKELFYEIEEQKSVEARIFKALDKLEVVIQHNEASIDTWIDLEYELNLIHGEKEAEEFPVLSELRAKAKAISIEKIENAKLKK